MQEEWILILSFCIPYFCFAGLWIFLIKKYFYWRPLVFARFVIANWIKRQIGSAVFWLCYILWWIFFSLPILIPAFFSIYLYKKYESIPITIVVAITPAVMFTLFITYKNYHHNGFKIGYTTKILLAICFALIFVVNIVTTILYTPEKNWKAYGFFFTAPSILIYGYCLCYSRRKIKKDAAKSILESDSSKRSFIYEICNRRFDNWFGGSHKLPWYHIIVVVASSVIFNFTFYGLWKDEPTLATASGSFVIDMLILIRQYLLPNQVQTVKFLFTAYLLKVFAIYNGPEYWLFSHSIYFLVFGIWFLTRFMIWLYNKSLCPRKKARLSQSLIDGEVMEQIEKITPEGIRPKSLEAIPSIVVFIIAVILAAVEIKIYGDDVNEKIFNDNTQKTGYITIIVVTIVISFILSVLICAYTGRGKISKLMLVTVISGIVFLHLFLHFYQDLNISSIQNAVIFMINFMAIDGILFCLSLSGNAFKLTKGTQLFIQTIIYMVLLIIISICLIIVPIVCLERSLIGVIITLGFLSAVFFFIFSHFFIMPTFKCDWVIYILLFCGFYMGYCMALYVDGYSFISFVSGVFGVLFIAYGITLIWCYRNQWTLSLGPMLISTIISCVVTGLLMWQFIVSEYKLSTAVFAYVFALIACGSVYIFAMQKSRYSRSALSICSIVFYCIFGVAMLVLIFLQNSTPYFVYTIASIVTAVLAVGCAVTYVLMNSKTTVLVLTNFFFPARNYYSGTIHKIPIFTTAYLLLIVDLWMWGLFGMISDNLNIIPPIMITAAFTVTSLFGIALLIELDQKCLSSLQYISTEAITHAVGKAMHAAGVSSNLKVPTKVDKSNPQKYLDAERQFNKMNSAISYFITALKAQLYISSQMAFLMAKDKLKTILSSKNIECNFLDECDFTPEERSRVINLYLNLTGQSSVKAPTADLKQNITVKPHTATTTLPSPTKTKTDTKPKTDTKTKSDTKSKTDTKSKSDKPLKPADTSNASKAKTTNNTNNNSNNNSSGGGGWFGKWFNKNSEETHASTKCNYEPPWSHITEYMKMQDTIRKQIDNIPSNSTSKYVDNGFHPTKKVAETNNVLLNGVEWVRAEQLYEKQKFIDTCRPNDLVQGYFGDCYVVTAMSSICRSISNIKNLFYRPDIAVKNGLCCVVFKAMNKEMSVNVDTLIPMLNGKPRMVHPATERSPYWFCIVEKAYAKIVGSYSAATGGTPDEALYRLLGGFPINIDLTDLDVRESIASGELFKQMVEWNKRGSHLIAGSPEGSHFKKNRDGIVQGHAYNILDVVEFRGVQLLKLRNPWGEQEWKGDWSSESSMWKKYPAVASKCNFDKERTQTDGVFWMSFKDFTSNYAQLYCLIVNESLPHYRFVITNTMKPGDTDGAKPVTQSRDADCLPQYILRVSTDCTVKMFLERTGPAVPTWVYAVKGKEPVKKIYSGTKYKTEPMPENSAIYSFDWNLESGEWVIVVCRNKCDSESDYVLKMYSDRRIELTPLINCTHQTISTK